jgi:hypothetical protein
MTTQMARFNSGQMDITPLSGDRINTGQCSRKVNAKEENPDIFFCLLLRFCNGSVIAV